MEEELLKKIKEQVKELVGDNDKRLENIKKEYSESLQKAVDGLISKEDLDKALEDLTSKSSGLTKEKAEQLIKDVNDIGLKIQSMQESKIKTQSEKISFREAVKKALEESGMLTDSTSDEGEKIKRIDFFEKTGNKTTPRMEVKAAIDMTSALSYAEVEVGSPFKTTYDSELVRIPLNSDITTMQIFPVLNIRTKYFGILVEYDYTDGADTKAENTASDKSSVLFKTEEFKVFTIPTHFHISEEQLEDVDYLLDELEMLAPDKIQTKFDSKVLSATGDGSTDIKGLFASGNHTAFAAATYENTVGNATAIDLIGKMKLQAELSNYNPNIILIHPQKRDEIEGLKDLNENSLFNRSVKYDENGNLAFIKGLRVITNKQMGTNTMFVGSSLAARIGVRRNMSMVIGLDSDDLTKRMRTIVFGMRAAFGVRQAGAMIYEDDVATSITTINKS